MEPKTIVEMYLAKMEKMEFEAALEHVAADVEYINSPNTIVTGHAGVLSVLEPFFAPIDENKFEVLRIVAESHQVVVERLDKHRVADEWFELPVTGVFEVNAQKITYWREYFDLATVQSDLERILGGAK